MSKTIMISAGEASGDLHASNLIKALHQIDPSIHVTGMGSHHMQQAGAELILDCTEIAVMGIVEVLAKYRTIMRALNTLREAIRNNPPDLLILVDYQEFNFKLATFAKQQGVKVLFYISPQVWAWRPHRVKKIGERIDMMAVLFPFEEKFYKKANVPVRFVGNPLVDEAKASISKQKAQSKFALNPEQKTIGLFPGSRSAEIKRILPVTLAAARKLHKKHPQLQFILPIARTIDENDIRMHLSAYRDLDIRLVCDNPYDVMQVCDAIIAASGTTTLEIALMGIPSVITYRISPLSYFILSRMVTIDHIGLVNIVAEKEIIKEFIQHEATADNLAKEIDRILCDDDYRQNMLNELAQIKSLLGQKGGANNIAQLAYEMLGTTELRSEV